MGVVMALNFFSEHDNNHPIQGGNYMGGSYHWHKPASRFYISVYWQGKHYKIWKYNGEPIWHEKTANKLLSKIRAEIDDGVFLLQSYMPDSPISLGKYSRQWLSSLSLTPATMDFYRKEINYSVKYFGEDFDIRKFMFSKLQIFYNELPLTIKGKYHALNTLKTMLRFAYQDELIKKMPPFPKLPLENNQDIKYLSFDEQQTVISHIPEPDRPIFEFAMEFGLRIGEVIGLQKDCIAHDEVIIKRTMGKGGLRQCTKTGKNRVYGLTDRAKEILNRLPLSPSPYVFNRNGQTYSWKMLTIRWRKACKDSGISINLYNGIRHSLGGQLMDAGVELLMVSDILGHTDPKTTKKYCHRSKPTITNVLQFRGRLEDVQRTKLQEKTLIESKENWSGRVDLNHRPSEPHSDTLPDCATPRHAATC
jgi:integrase